MKKIIILFLITILNSCGYTSVYKDQKNQNLKITVNNMEGDFEANNFIKNELRLASNPKSKNNFKVDIESDYKKIIITKNSAGIATDYKLDLKVNFKILSEGNKIIQFRENFNIKKNSENFEQLTYERQIKKNLSILIKDRLISYLNKLNDN